MNKKLITGTVVALLALPATASAATKVYAGTTDGSGQLAMDVLVKKDGKLKYIKELRGQFIPVTCEQSGAQTVYFTFPTSIKVNKHHKFFSEWTQPTYNNKSSIRGSFVPKKVTNGTFNFSQHFVAENGMPEENCNSGDLGYHLDRGAPDVVPSPFRLNGGRAAGP
jgi:hypothetical protein